MDEKQGIIKKLNKIYKNGYMPSRGTKKYDQISTLAVNCFGHACFNLSNRSLKKLDLQELIDFFRNFQSVGSCNFFKEAKNRIKQVGLQIEESSLSESIQKNQWKIAYYVENDIFSGNDLHFMIQGKDGKWIGKIGTNPKIEIYEKLPNIYREKYYLSGVYKITNPYIKLQEDKSFEM